MTQVVWLFGVEKSQISSQVLYCYISVRIRTNEKICFLNVIHGDIDPLVPVTGGHDTHQNVPDAELMIIEGMGHDLPKGAWDQIVKGIASLTDQAKTKIEKDA